MKDFLVIKLLFFCTFTTLGQWISLEEWDKQAEKDHRLLPKYGLTEKTAEQQERDERFIEATMKQEQFEGNRTTASKHIIRLGFDYLYRGDFKTAMFRFNQAYLLDSLNEDIYWGYGAVYMALGSFSRAREQYEEGLSLNPKNTHLLTDYATYFLANYYEFESFDNELASTNLDSAIELLLQSYQIDATNENTTYKLSISYWLKDDCENAWKYYDECKATGGKPITEAYTNDLRKKCEKK
jgi:tetratricopeptide (TPR) repeat protein